MSLYLSAYLSIYQNLTVYPSIYQSINLSSHASQDRITYNAAISACEKSQEWQQALILLGQAERQRMQLGIISYNAAISACDKGGQWELALHLLYEAVWKRLRPQLTSYNAAASACAKELRWYEAVILLGQLNEAGMEDARAWIVWGRSFQKFDAQASGLFALKPLILKLPRLATYLASMDASEISFMLGLLSEEHKKNFEIVSSLETEQPMLKLSYLSDFRHPIVAKAAPEWVADLFAAVHEEMPPTPSGSTTLLSCNMSFNESLATRFFDLMGEEAERAPRLARRRWQNRLQRQFLTYEPDIICLQRVEADITAPVGDDGGCANAVFWKRCKWSAICWGQGSGGAICISLSEVHEEEALPTIVANMSEGSEEEFAATLQSLKATAPLCADEDTGTTPSILCASGGFDVARQAAILEGQGLSHLRSATEEVLGAEVPWTEIVAPNTADELLRCSDGVWVAGRALGGLSGHQGGPRRKDGRVCRQTFPCDHLAAVVVLETGSAEQVADRLENLTLQ
eukprot:s278_g29.t1